MKEGFVLPFRIIERIARAARISSFALAGAAYGTEVFLFSKSLDHNIPWMSNMEPDGGWGSGPPGPRRGRNPLGVVFAIALIVLVIGGFFGLALYRAGNLSDPTSEWVSSAPGTQSVSCQYLIDRAMQASDDSCDQLGTNQVCYGNNTLLAELITGAASRFSQRGDRVNVADLQRLAASPLSLASEDWGIAVFKVLANLPRSLPGETITMVVFGNTTLDNISSDLQTFYFSSTLGQIQCDQVPFDGLMITMPDGAGIRFVINGAEMILMGNASIAAAQNGTMRVTLLSGSATITSSGQTQIVTAGESTSMALGGPDGRTVVSPPSSPQPLSQEDMTMACTLTGNFCSPQQITPVNPLDAVATLIAKLGLDGSTNPAGNAAVPTVIGTPSLVALPQQSGNNSPSSQSLSTSTFINTVTFALPFTSTYTFQPTIINTLPPTAMDTLPPPPTNTPPPPPTNTFPPPPTNPPPPTEVPMITICHATGSGSYNEITIPNTGSGGHWNHPDDIIPAPAGGCP